MKTANWYKKITTAALLSGSFLVFGGIYQSVKVSDTSFMNDDEIKFVKRFDETRDRYVASAERELKQKYNVAIQYLPVNPENRKLINGKWEITRIEDENKKEVYNKEKQDRKIIVNFDLIKTSMIRINDDEKYTFDLSYIHESKKTIALFRSFGKGYELIEAKRVEGIDQYKPTTELSREEAVNKLEEKTALRVEQTADLVLERAMVPASKITTVQIGEERVSGELTVAPEGIDSFTFSVKSKSGEALEYSVDNIQMDANGAGTFTAEVNGEASNGIATNNGNDAYRIRFATGPLKGSLLNFVTDEELIRIQEERERTQELLEERQSENAYENEVKQEELVVKQEQAVESRKNVVDAGYQANQAPKQEFEELSEEEEREIEELEEVDALEDPEEMSEEVNRQGFGF